VFFLSPCIPSFYEKSKTFFITSNKFSPGGIKAKMGKFSVYLYPVKKLPVITEDEPDPLI
jgi:hypothetical protein